MRRDGLLTGYLWSRNSFGKVKVKGKPTNASKASARCSRAKCSSCHDQPVSKAKSKTKGRNKRALSRLPIDDEWAVCKRSSAGHASIKAVPAQAHHNDCHAYDALDVCNSDAEWTDHDLDNDDASDACHACHDQVIDNALDAADAIVDHHITIAVDVSDAGMHAHDDVKDDTGMLTSVAAHDARHSQQVLGSDGKLYTVTYPTPVTRLTKVAPHVNSGICAKTFDVFIEVSNVHMHAPDVSIAVDVSDADMHANHGCHAAMAHAKEDVALEKEVEDNDANDGKASQESHAHAAEDVSNDDDDVHSNEDANDFQSLISGLVNVGWPTRDNDEESLEVECEENSLGGDWCYVASTDTIDDWYLC